MLGGAYPTTLEGQTTTSKMRSCGIIMKSLSAANLFFYKQWYDAGVKTLPDILDKEGKFLTFTAFKEKYKINTNVLLYWLV